MVNLWLILALLLVSKRLPSEDICLTDDVNMNQTHTVALTCVGVSHTLPLRLFVFSTFMPKQSRNQQQKNVSPNQINVLVFFSCPVGVHGSQLIFF